MLIYPVYRIVGKDRAVIGLFDTERKAKDFLRQSFAQPEYEFDPHEHLCWNNLAKIQVGYPMHLNRGNK